MAGGWSKEGLHICFPSRNLFSVIFFKAPSDGVCTTSAVCPCFLLITSRSLLDLSWPERTRGNTSYLNVAYSLHRASGVISQPEWGRKLLYCWSRATLNPTSIFEATVWYVKKSLNKPFCYSGRKWLGMCLSWCMKSWSVAVMVRLRQYCECLKGSWRSGRGCWQDLSWFVTSTQCHVLIPSDTCCNSYVFDNASFSLEGVSVFKRMLLQWKSQQD